MNNTNDNAIWSTQFCIWDTFRYGPKYNLTSVWTAIYFYVTLEHLIFSGRQDVWTEYCWHFFWKTLTDDIKSSSWYLEILDEICFCEIMTHDSWLQLHVHTHIHTSVQKWKDQKKKKKEWTKPWIALIHFCNIIQDRLEACSKRPQNYLSTPSCVWTQPNPHSRFFCREMYICTVMLLSKTRGKLHRLCLQYEKAKPVGGTERERHDYNCGIRGVICTGWQLVELSRYLLLVLSQSSSVLLYVITVVNLLVLPCLLPTLCLPY